MLAKEVLFWFTDPILTSVVPGCAISPQLRQHRKVEDAAHTNYFMTPETFHHIWIASSFAWYYFEACVALSRRVHILFSTFDHQWVMCATCELDAYTHFLLKLFHVCIIAHQAHTFFIGQSLSVFGADQPSPPAGTQPSCHALAPVVGRSCEPDWHIFYCFFVCTFSTDSLRIEI